MRPAPFNHPHAHRFDYRQDVGRDGVVFGVLTIGTDLDFPGWSETPAGCSLMEAVTNHLSRDRSQLKQIDVIPLRYVHANAQT